MCIGPFAPSPPNIPPPPPPPVLPELPDPSRADVGRRTAAARDKARKRAALALNRSDRVQTTALGLTGDPSRLKTVFGT